jgi:hypothetical protein
MVTVKMHSVLSFGDDRFLSLTIEMFYSGKFDFYKNEIIRKFTKTNDQVLIEFFWNVVDPLVMGK